MLNSINYFLIIIINEFVWRVKDDNWHKVQAVFVLDCFKHHHLNFQIEKKKRVYSALTCHHSGSFGLPAAGLGNGNAAAEEALHSPPAPS